MKKLLTLVLALIYLTASSGVVVNVHYCMGKVSKVKIDNFASAICKCDNPEKSKSCCKNEFKVVKLDNAHKAPVISQTIGLPVTQFPVVISLLDVSAYPAVAAVTGVEHGPPLPSSPIYLLDRVLRI